MKLKKIIIILVVIGILILAALSFFSKSFILSKIQSTVIKNIEKTIDRKIDIGDLFYLPHKGLILKDIKIYKEALPDKAIFVKALNIKVDLPALLNTKEILASLNFESLKTNGADINGVFVIKSAPIKNIFLPFKNLSIDAVKISGLNLRSNFIKLKNLYGLISFNGPIASVNIKDTDLNADFIFEKANNNLIKINKANIGFFDSYFECKGEIQNLGSEPLLILNVHSPAIRIDKYRIKDVSFDLELDKNSLSIPSLKASPYNGALNTSFYMDLSKNNMPYNAKLKLKGLDINRFVEDVNAKIKNLYGKLDIGFAIDGYANDDRTIKGSGNISIYGANLGPMPVLYPLMGYVYAGIRDMFPALKNVEISGAYCDFAVHDRKIISDNILLSGDLLEIRARGYMDFDRNLNFDVENELKEKTVNGEEWEKALLDIITNVGKFVGSARLTGTLEKPKWKMKYFNKFEDALGGGLEKVIKDIFE